jgi:hypothetical protein
MLNAYIIEELKKMKEKRRIEEKRPVLRIPLEDEIEKIENQDEDDTRSVVIIDFNTYP